MFPISKAIPTMKTTYDNDTHLGGNLENSRPIHLNKKRILTSLKLLNSQTLKLNLNLILLISYN